MRRGRRCSSRRCGRSSLLFRAAVALRRALYRRGILRTVRLPVPVVVVGNITVGGSGKTPLVAALARALAQRGHRPGIVSRGYGARSRRRRADRGRRRRRSRRGSATSRCCSRARAFRSSSPATAWRPGRALLARHPRLRRDPRRRRPAALPARARRRDRRRRRDARAGQAVAAAGRPAARAAPRGCAKSMRSVALVADPARPRPATLPGALGDDAGGRPSSRASATPRVTAPAAQFAGAGRARACRNRQSGSDSSRSSRPGHRGDAASVSRPSSLRRPATSRSPARARS